MPKEESASLLRKPQNWKLTSLLNVDYKIDSNAIAKEIEPLLSSLKQTGYVKGRYIGENIRRISDMIEQTKKLRVHSFGAILAILIPV